MTLYFLRFHPRWKKGSSSIIRHWSPEVPEGIYSSIMLTWEEL